MMLQSILENKVLQILLSHDQESHSALINWSTVEILIAYLEPFACATTIFERGSYSHNPSDLTFLKNQTIFETRFPKVFQKNGCGLSKEKSFIFMICIYFPLSQIIITTST